LRKFFLVLPLVALAIGASAQSKRSITDKDLFQFNWIGDYQVSPDGSKVAFVRVNLDEKKTGYETSLWMVPATGGAPIRLTNGKRDSAPRWSPDGRWIAFVRAPETPAVGSNGTPGARQPGAQIALLSMTGGEAWTITDVPRGASNPVWSPDGKRIAFLCDANRDDLKKRDKKDADPAEKEHESDVKVITRAVYRYNGQGYLDPKHHEHIWIEDIPAGPEAKPAPRQLTEGDFDEAEPLFTPDGGYIVFRTERNVEPYYEQPTSEVMEVPANGGDLRSIANIPMDIGGMALSPDGKHLAFHGEITQPVHSYQQPDLWVMDFVVGAKPVNLTANYDYDMGSGVGGDNAAPRGGGREALQWSQDGRKLYDIVAKEGRAILVSVDAQSGAVVELTHGDQAVQAFSRSKAGQTTVVKVSTPTMINELFVVEGEKQRQITKLNDALFAQLNLTEPEEFTYSSFDGKKIQAWIQRPPGFDRNQKYPMILNIHGGPHAAYGYVFDHEFQLMAAKGYVVLYPNPRGSTSYGQDFGNIIQYNYPGDDFRDLMTGVDELLKKGYIDEQRLGVTGGSGGGLLTDWTVGHTDRFRAAVAQRDISDWASWWYTADFTEFQPTWFKAPPFADPSDFVRRSPITYITQVKTPMMFILGDADWRTPPESGGEQMFRALKFLHKPTVMVRFPRESHELSRSGEPWHRVERLDHITGWFDKWIMGVNKPEYNQPGEVNVPPASKQEEKRPPGTSSN
jgi:dipeptidyl aminopeptidase/acylaminoacyl peptidase